MNTALRLALLTLTLVLTCTAAPAHAHEGPPFPVIVDEPMPPWTVTVWADPDVGLGTFWVQLEPQQGATLPGDEVVSVSVAPADGRLQPVTYRARREVRENDVQHKAEVDFPTREFWTVSVSLTAANGTITYNPSFSVEVTPPGYGPVDLLLYVWPFLALGALWVLGMRKHRATLAAEAAAPAAPTTD